MTNNGQNTGGIGSQDQQTVSAPFSIRILKKKNKQAAESSSFQHKRRWLQSLLPASYRKDSDDLAAACHHVAACVDKELDLRRLDSIYDRLWIVGRPRPPRPLHKQLLLGREIFVTERMDEHLVWTAGRMFLKPIPRFLLEPDFWAEYLDCTHDGRHCSLYNGAVSPNAVQICERKDLHQRALGFLFSYAALISYESDFYIAKGKHLLPPEVTWLAWRTFVEQLGIENIYPRIHRRFKYGEMRLSRLNKIYFLSQTPLRGYIERWDQYGTYFHDNLAWVGSAIVYVAIVLTAMQVGLATESLSHNDAFQSASYGFTVFSIFAPIAASLLILFIFCCYFIYNWNKTVRYKNKRLQKQNPG